MAVQQAQLITRFYTEPTGKSRANGWMESNNERPVSESPADRCLKSGLPPIRPKMKRVEGLDPAHEQDSRTPDRPGREQPQHSTPGPHARRPQYPRLDCHALPSSPKSSTCTINVVRARKSKRCRRDQNDSLNHSY